LCKSYICSLNLYVFLNVFAVEAYAASWIEMVQRRGISGTGPVEAYVASWIETENCCFPTSRLSVEAYVAL